MDLGGRPLIEFSDDDWLQIEECCEIHCTGEEIASIMRVSYDTLERRIKERYAISFAEYFAQRSSHGKKSLRRRQYTMAMEGNPTMLIWIGKNWLKQTDAVEHSGNVNFKLNYNLDDDSTGE